jgi:uncharacterized flavoprotein (TIGR03862 family)
MVAPIVAVIGGGPAGLMAAERIIAAGARVSVYDAMASVGRKFLLAGKGGLNLTHAEPFDRLLGRYRDRRHILEPILTAFDADTLRQWSAALGIDTVVGSSGRVFPKDMKAAPLLRAWLHRLRGAGVQFHMHHRWLGWMEDGSLAMRAPDGNTSIRPDAVVLALGGGSWARLGSDGAWVPLLRDRGVHVHALQPSNCGFELPWSPHLRERHAGKPVKPVIASVEDLHGCTIRQQGEFVITESGVEGGLIYALSAPLRERIARDGEALLLLDLAPSHDLGRLLDALSQPHGKQSIAKVLKHAAAIDGVKSALLHEVLPPPAFHQPALLAAAIKSLPLRVRAPRPIDEAISTAGGVCFDELDSALMLRKVPGVFCAGEMLDWEAPTGGYLLTACMATGRAAGDGAAAWLRSVGRL